MSSATSPSEGEILASRLEVLQNCTGCGRCVAACAHHALTLVTPRADGFGRKSARVDLLRCTRCSVCIPACPHNALHFTTP